MTVEIALVFTTIERSSPPDRPLVEIAHTALDRLRNTKDLVITSVSIAWSLL